MNVKAPNNRSKPLSKITVKHFININLKDSKAKYASFDDKGKYHDMTPPFHPLYVKITFQRATTQMKSLIGLDFTSVEEAEFKCGWLMDVESKMISDVIRREYEIHGDKFNLKGINEKCRPFSNRLYDYFAKSYLTFEFNKFILHSRSPYMRMLFLKENDSPGIVYYDAAIKLLGESQALLQFRDKFILFDQFENVIKKGKIAHIKVIQWVYDDAREQFSQAALSCGLTFKQVVNIVTAIDEQVMKIN